MIQGVGVRLTDYGARIISLGRSDGGISVTGLAAGPRDEVVTSFLEKKKELDIDLRVVVGLGPGDFLTAMADADPGTDPDELRSQLRWELEQKILSPASDYTFDFIVAGERGFGFAGRKRHVAEAVQSWGRAVTDVEPVALFNGCEALGLLGEDTTALVSIESEGVTVVVVSRKTPVAMDSAVYRDQGISTTLAGLDPREIAGMTGEETARLIGYVRESIDRVTSFGGDSRNPTPRGMVLAGAGIAVRGLPELIREQYGIDPVLSDPFSSMPQEVGLEYPAYAAMGGAFTTGFGLALRALEE